MTASRDTRLDTYDDAVAAEVARRATEAHPIGPAETLNAYITLAETVTVLDDGTVVPHYYMITPPHQHPASAHMMVRKADVRLAVRDMFVGE